MSQRGDDYFNMTVDWMIHKIHWEKDVIEGNAKTMFPDMQESAKEQLELLDEVIDLLNSRRKG